MRWGGHVRDRFGGWRQPIACLFRPTPGSERSFHCSPLPAECARAQLPAQWQRGHAKHQEQRLSHEWQLLSGPINSLQCHSERAKSGRKQRARFHAAAKARSAGRRAACARKLWPRSHARSGDCRLPCPPCARGCMHPSGGSAFYQRCLWPPEGACCCGSLWRIIKSSRHVQRVGMRAARHDTARCLNHE